MKKFVFSLQQLYDVKTSEESDARNRLAGFLKERDRLEKLIAENKRRYDEQLETYSRECENGINGLKLRGYGEFFDYLLGERKRLQAYLSQCEQRVGECQARLLRLMNEKKVLDRMREEQLEEYRREVRRDEDKALEDFMSSGMQGIGG